ncbi:NADH-flavin oxidoreductase/NADH oxidase [Rhizodiscina lignyota]|uniref:NADH-flavin oxidoreductase/NADH oxidase n=1 Tax=Rhizodiscina lignyota TaxID=1504668 RepID=A0A9P4IM78_9PEZI|nr:NADH-flavin oxidoreductase/NADH oxidase [Rhizodiscina lignyota]
MAVTDTSPLSPEDAHLTRPSLFAPLKVGNMLLAHRVVMSPLTRSRSPAGIPLPELAELYYSQRASPGGLIISEGCHPSVILTTFQGGSYDGVPGIYTPEQVRAWKKITDAVHEKGGYIFCQLWHTGRTALPMQIGGRLPLSSSSASRCPFPNRMVPSREPQECVIPKEMTREDMHDTIEDHVHAAQCAIEAGFDGVEIQGANGYLVDQFLCDNINRRADSYGGPVSNRARFPLELLDAVVAAVGPERTATRFSPFGTFQGAGDSDPLATFSYMLAEVDKRGLAYVCLTDPRSDLFLSIDDKLKQAYDMPWAQRMTEAERRAKISLRYFRGSLKSTVMFANGRFDGENCFAPVAEGDVDGVVFGRWFISNPDLPERLRLGKKLAMYVPKQFYTPGHEGYTDYPTWELEVRSEL